MNQYEVKYKATTMRRALSNDIIAWYAKIMKYHKHAAIPSLQPVIQLEDTLVRDGIAAMVSAKKGDKFPTSDWIKARSLYDISDNDMIFHVMQNNLAAERISVPEETLNEKFLNNGQSKIYNASNCF